MIYGYARCSTNESKQDINRQIKELKAAGVPYDVHKCGGLIGNHAWAIATIVKPAQECLAHTWEFTLPYLPAYF